MTDSNSSNRLASGYQKLMEFLHEKPGIDHALERLSEWEELTREEVVKIGDYLKRELAFEAVAAVTVRGEKMPLPAFVTLCISGGRKEKVRAGDILGALTGEAGISGNAVGKITVTDYSAYVAIARNEADKALGRLLNGKIKGRKFKVRKL